MHTIVLPCSNCGKDFDKAFNEYARRSNAGKTRFFCSRKCGNANSGKFISEWQGKFNENLNVGSEKDHLSEFRVYLRRAKRRNKEVLITVEDLHAQWHGPQWSYHESSDSWWCKCPYSGVWLAHPLPFMSNDPIHTASLDRIDSSLGYVPGNIQFVSMACNYAKSVMTHEQMIRFCGVMAQNNQDKIIPPLH